MKITLDDKHINFFKENGFIEFEELLPQNEMEHLSLLLPELKEKHDLFRKEALIKKIVTHSTLAQVAKQLTGLNALRLGFDHLIPNAVPNPLTLDTWVPLQGIACGLLLHLSEKAGSGLFFSPETPVELPTTSSLLITYVKDLSVFIKKDSNILTHAFRDLGYQYGDRLSDTVNPIVYK